MFTYSTSSMSCSSPQKTPSFRLLPQILHTAQRRTAVKAAEKQEGKSTAWVWRTGGKKTKEKEQVLRGGEEEGKEEKAEK